MFTLFLIKQRPSLIENIVTKKLFTFRNKEIKSSFSFSQSDDIYLPVPLRISYNVLSVYLFNQVQYL